MTGSTVEADPIAGKHIEEVSALVRAHGLIALAMVAYVALLGLAVAAKFVWPDWLGGEGWLTLGRLRPAHTQGIFFGWLGNAFLAFFYHAVPRLAGRPVTSRALGWGLFVVWNFLLTIPGWAMLHAGLGQPLEWAEFPRSLDFVAVLAFGLAAVQFVLPFLRAGLADLYVSGWYILGGLTFTLFAYAVGNFAPEAVPGARGATYSGLWIHDAVGLYVTPFAVAIAYIVIPVTTGRPIYSHFLSMLGFWLLFLIYPLNGTHHYVFSSIPMEAQKGAIVASVYLGLDVILVVSNLLLSLRASAAAVGRDPALRFVWLSIVLYLVVSLQGSMQALMPVNRFVHFSDWVIGHSHLAMIGFASFAAIGGLFFAWQRTPGIRFNKRAADWAFWFLTIGLALMVLDLTAAGLVQGGLWESDTAWGESVNASAVFWQARLLSGLVLFAGFLLLPVALLSGPVAQAMGATSGDSFRVPAHVRTAQDPEAAAEPHGLAWLRSAYVLTGVAGFGMFLFSFVVLAVWPNRELEMEIANTKPVHLPEPSLAELRGRALYIREGCINCHSQLVRATEADVRRFGFVSQAWEGENDTPQLWGTRRVGPDLSREAGKKSRDWQLAHLWNPRHVVPWSNMPPYPWLFDGSATKPTGEARDLVAYLESLGRDAQLAGLGTPAPISTTNAEEEKRLGMFCDCAIARTRGPAPVFAAGTAPGEQARLALRGAREFTEHCAGCHGASGRGDGPAAPSLLPLPRDLTSARFSEKAVSQALWHGVRGSSMPSFADLSVGELRGLVAYVQSLGPPDRESVTPTEPERVAALFRHNCASCHGNDGRGNERTATTLAPAPTDLTLVQPTVAYAEAAVAHGVPGTAMPAWKSKITEADRVALVRYVRSLYPPEGGR